MAIWRRGQMRAAGAIHHSDQGSQYTSFAFTRRLAAQGLVASTGTVGDALDNAMCESLIGTMKIEKAQPAALAVRRGRPRRRLRLDRDVVQPPPQALQPR